MGCGCQLAQVRGDPVRPARKAFDKALHDQPGFLLFPRRAPGSIFHDGGLRAIGKEAKGHLDPPSQDQVRTWWGRDSYWERMPQLGPAVSTSKVQWQQPGPVSA